jgi:general stress protein YciG
MDPQRQREIASQGGRAAHAKGTAHEFTSEEARRAGAMSHKNGNRQSASRGNSQDSQQEQAEVRNDNRQG